MSMASQVAADIHNAWVNSIAEELTFALMDAGVKLEDPKNVEIIGIIRRMRNKPFSE